jgi:pseudouridine synthase
MKNPEPEQIRLQKILSERGIASRREAEKLIAAGHVRVNGKVVTELGTKADPATDTIEVDQQILKKKEVDKVVIALNKPPGFVTSTKTTAVEKNIVFDLLPKQYKGLFPIGRLDKDTSGLLLLTNDGDLAFRLTHPSFAHSKTYHVLLSKPINDQQLEKIRNGDIQILGRRMQPAPAKILGGARIEMILREGKNRQIRRMFRELGTGVKKLRRVAVGALDLADINIPKGRWKELNEKEISRLKMIAEEEIESPNFAKLRKPRGWDE